MSQDIESYIIKTSRHIRMETTRKEIRYRYKPAIYQLSMTIQPGLINIFKMMEYSQNLYLPKFISEKIVTPNTPHI